MSRRIHSRRVGSTTLRCVRRGAGIMVQTARGVVRVLNSANAGIRIGPRGVMSGALIAAVSTCQSVTSLLPEDLDRLPGGDQADSLENRRLVRSQELRAALSTEWNLGEA